MTDAGSAPPSPSKSGRTPWLRRLLILAGGLLLLVLIAVALLPRLIDPNRYRPEIEQVLTEATSWQASLGEIDVRVLGGLALEVHPVTLDGGEGGSRIEAQAIRIHGRWLPLLRGRLEITRIDLLEPKVHLVRRTAEEGWQLPAGLGGSSQRAPAGEGEGTAGGTPAGGAKAEAAGAGAEAASAPSWLSIREIRLIGGTLTAEDLSGAAPLKLGLEHIDLRLRPETLAAEGRASLPEDQGTIALSGSVGEKLTATLDEVSTEALTPFTGPDLIHPGGSVSGTLSYGAGGRLEGKLGIERAAFLAGIEPLERMEADFQLESEAESWRLDRLELDLDGAKVHGTGEVFPALAVRLTVEPTGLEEAVDAMEALFPFPLDLSPPGSVGAVIDLGQNAKGELTYRIQGEATAARLRLADDLWTVEDLAADFRLDQRGELTVKIGQAEVGGGPLKGTVRVVPVYPPGELLFEGTLGQSRLGALLAPFAGERAAMISGTADVSAKLRLDLGAEELTPAALEGGLEIEAVDLGLPGWDIGGAIEGKLASKLGKLSSLGLLKGSEAPREEEAGGQAKAPRELFESLSARATLDKLPWALSDIVLVSKSFNGRGAGEFDPVEGKIRLALEALLTPEATKRLVAKHRQARALVSGDRLAIPLELRGPLTSPGVTVDLSRLAPGKEKKKKIKGLLKGLFDKRK